MLRIGSDADPDPTLKLGHINDGQILKIFKLFKWILYVINKDLEHFNV